MARLATFAAAFGVMAGLWSAAAVYAGIVGKTPNFCLTLGLIDCSRTSSGGIAIESLGVLLVLSSLVCFIGPRRLFYVSAALSALIAGLALVVPGVLAGVLATLGVSLVEIILGIAAARREPRVSEQSHPMNLPVFG